METSLSGNIATLEVQRIEHAETCNSDMKSLFGQFFTPYIIAKYMADLLPIEGLHEISVLDPGAGIGT